MRDAAAAPGGLEFVMRFVNTLDIDAGTDEIDSASRATAWLGEQGWSIEVDDSSRLELVRFREVLRDAVAQRGGPRGMDAAERLEALARSYPVLVRISSKEALWPASMAGVGAFIEAILGQVATARIDGSWERIKTCANDRCRWLFYDGSRNRSRTWCSMSACGSRAKMRAYRLRRARSSARRGMAPDDRRRE